MEMMKVLFLGTGNAIPTKLRNHSGILVSFAKENILVDCGEGIQRQLRIAGITPGKISRILITHWHGDHMLGLPGLFQTLAMSNYERTLKIYGPPGTRRHVNLIEELLLGLKINLQVHELTTTLVDEKDFYIESKPMDHGTPTNAYSIVLKERRRLDKKKLKKYKLPNSPLLGQLQEGQNVTYEGKLIKASAVSYVEEGKKLAIILDTKMNSQAIVLAKDADLLITESTFSQEEKERALEYKHLTAADAGTIAKKAKVKKLILTHISERYEHNFKKIEREAKKIFRNTLVAKDFDHFVL